MHGEVTAHFFEAVEKQITGAGSIEPGLAVITTHGDEVGLRGMVEAAQAFSHERNLSRESGDCQ
jgi:hypothetical protein